MYFLFMKWKGLGFFFSIIEQVACEINSAACSKLKSSELYLAPYRIRINDMYFITV